MEGSHPRCWSSRAGLFAFLPRRRAIRKKNRNKGPVQSPPPAGGGISLAHLQAVMVFGDLCRQVHSPGSQAAPSQKLDAASVLSVIRPRVELTRIFIVRT